MIHTALMPLREMTRRAVSRALAAARAGDLPVFAVDATAGNGHDTLFLAKEAGETGRVFAFDVQQSALAAAARRLRDAGEDLFRRATFIHAGHETIRTALPHKAAGGIRAATFNLGYLPGSDKRVVTEPAATIAALEALTAMAAPGCVISVHAYRGHGGGETEFGAVSLWLKALPWETWRVAEYSFANKLKNKETVFLLEKMRISR